MSTPLLATKFYLPRARPDLIHRPRLTARLAQALERPLTLLSAPAGFGKTTLLSEWAPHNPECIAWVSLDEGDKDPLRFWNYFIAALKRAMPGLDESMLAMLHAPQPPPIETMLTTLLNEVAAFSTSFALVLDDYHLITTDSIHTGLTFLLDHLPPNLHLILTTRADPPLPLARLRARGQLLEFRAADLRFTPDEAAAFLNTVMGLHLSAEQAAALEQRTEGWIAGLQLAALSMQNRSDVDSFLAAFTGSHRHVVEYLIEEVFNRQPESIQVFLLQTSILDRMTGSLCDAVTGRAGGGAVLEHLQRANLFIVPLDDAQQWYRYHHLFADLLRHRLTQSQAGHILELHSRASAWHAQHGFLADAVSHALSANDWEQAMRLIEPAAGPMLVGGEAAALLHWLSALPASQLEPRPRLNLLLAWSMLIVGKIDDIEQRLHVIERGLGVGDDARIVLSEVLAIRAAVAAAHGNAADTLALSLRALDLIPADNHGLRGAVLLNLGNAHALTGHAAQAASTFAEAFEHNQAAGNTLAATFALNDLGVMQMLQAHLHQASQTFQKASGLSLGPKGKLLPFGCVALWGTGAVAYEWNDLGTARRHMATALELGRLWGNAEALVSIHLILARIAQADGEAESALGSIDKAAEYASGQPMPRTASAVPALQASLWIRQNNLSAALGWAELSGLQLDDKPHYLREPEYLALARLRIAHASQQTAEARLAEVIELLARIRRAADTGGRIEIVIETLILESLSLQAQHKSVEAFAQLERALTLAEPEGFIRKFVDEGEPMRRLIETWIRDVENKKRAPGETLLLAYAQKLLSAFSPPITNNQLPITDSIEPLTDRERDVLRLLAAGLSNREIADELVVSVDTVKTHLRTLYAKLGAHSRTQALLRAEELKLIK